MKENLTGSSDLLSGGKPSQTSGSHSKFPLKLDKDGLDRVYFFMTLEQQAIFANPNNKLIVIEGKAGTGKTLLLKAKALELVRDNKDIEILYVINSKTTGSSRNDCKMFREMTVEDFKSNPSIRVLGAHENDDGKKL